MQGTWLYFPNFKIGFDQSVLPSFYDKEACGHLDFLGLVSTLPGCYWALRHGFKINLSVITSGVLKLIKISWNWIWLRAIKFSLPCFQPDNWRIIVLLIKIFSSMLAYNSYAHTYHVKSSAAIINFDQI